jgi:hypothetical protein
LMSQFPNFRVSIRNLFLTRGAFRAALGRGRLFYRFQIG